MGDLDLYDEQTRAQLDRLRQRTGTAPDTPVGATGYGRNSVDLAIVALNTAIGYDFVTRESLPVPEKKVSTPPVMEQDFNAIDNRPELQVIQKMSQAKELLYIKAKRQNYPVLNAYGSYDLDTGDLATFEGSYTVGLKAEWDIFTGFRNSSAARKAEAEWRAAQQDAENVRNEIKQDLRRARIEAAESWQRLETIRKSVESASESLRITRVRYREGVAGITDLDEVHINCDSVLGNRSSK